MISNLDDFAKALNSLNPTTSNFEEQVDDLIEDTSPDLLEHIYPVVIEFFETFPDDYCGTPGTLVHVIETYYPNYVDRLLSSIHRRPACSTALMMNRIINSKSSNKSKNTFIKSLEGSLNCHNVSLFLKKEIQEIISYQRCCLDEWSI